MPETKLRSSLIAGSFVAYGLGSLAINIVTLWIPGVSWIVYIAGFLIYISTIPGFFSYTETPKYLHRKGKLTELIDSLYSIAKFNKKSNITEFDFYEAFVDRQTYEIIKNNKIEIEVRSFGVNNEDFTDDSRNIFYGEATELGSKENKTNKVSPEEVTNNQISPIKQLFSSRK